MRFELPDDKTLTHELLIPIRWGDMDAMGHVNNAMYFRYMETVRLAWFESLGTPPEPRGQGPVIVNAFCNFKRQLVYPGSVLARHYIGAVGRSSIETYVTLARADEPGLIHADGGAKIVWSDALQQRSVPLPERLRAQLDGLRSPGSLTAPPLDRKDTP